MTEIADLSDLSGIEEIENIWIPMPDGVRLAARLWRPRDAAGRPVPAILEFLPYRKRDFMRSRDEPMHRYYAMSGYASLRVDLRGSGDSEGVLHDEYSPAEHADAVAIIEWLAEQPWCSGAVGMTGISWGGFNALQVAALAPPALKAIITLCAADDRYSDDAHYKGGCLLNENMQWGSILMLYNALPPDPDISGPGWRDQWKARIEAVEPSPMVWMRHSSRDEYWRHGSVCEDWSAIRCPVYAIGGWADGYTNAIPRLLENLSGPRKGLIGPWAHAFPHDAVPGPAIGYLQEAVRWWDHWLKGRDTGIMDEPVFRAWMQDSIPPQPQYETWPGHWVAESEWPSPRIEQRRLYLNWGFLADTPGTVDEIAFSSPHTLGVRGGEWCGFGADGEAARDQRADDGGSLVFDSDALDDPIELLGAPVLELDIMANRPVAFLIARLCDVHPDGASSRISYGILNLCHRDGHDAPQPMVPGKWYRVRLTLDVLGQTVPAGHHLRLGLSTDYWPMIWPTPEAVTLHVRVATGFLDLPVRPPRAEDALLPEFGPPIAAAGSQHKKLRHLPMRRTIEIDLATSEMVYTLRGDGGELGGAALSRIEEINLDIGYTMMKRYRIIENDPLSAQTELSQAAVLRRNGWSVRVECRTRLSATADAFQFSGDLEAFEADVPFASRHWTVAIPRQCL
ncbi:CocE/NonD family hydrolase [Oceanibacterium hippocampi]|uniref:Cocaine esterase n=1 Tax=Oceanibacterium hippocampi TaxID=745714 RepID=A0A1Y5RX47_9PROT|nr:CocE/NonD family hydrolase [Oceanibacterium hippocampi]SLN27237.1 Cocaine esterase [Oceanibacterium hippocampi]